MDEEEEKEEQEEHDDQTESQPGSVLSEMDAQEVHKKRKTLLGQLSADAKTESQEMVEWKQRKLEEYKNGSKLVKHQILAD